MKVQNLTGEGRSWTLVWLQLARSIKKQKKKFLTKLEDQRSLGVWVFTPLCKYQHTVFPKENHSHGAYSPQNRKENWTAYWTITGNTQKDPRKDCSLGLTASPLSNRQLVVLTLMNSPQPENIKTFWSSALGRISSRISSSFLKTEGLKLLLCPGAEHLESIVF